MVTYSRVYTGRHSFDQLIVGVSLGMLCTHFTFFYYVPNFYDHIMDYSIKHDNWKYFKYSVIYFCFMILLAVLIFVYVDKNVPIPEEWYTQIKQLCRKFKKNDAFHYNTLTGIGHQLYFPAYFFLRAIGYDKMGSKGLE